MRENNDINFLSKHKLMMCTMVILRFIMCIAFYICNWSLYEKCHTYYGMSGIPYKEGFVIGHTGNYLYIKVKACKELLYNDVNATVKKIDYPYVVSELKGVNK